MLKIIETLLKKYLSLQPEKRQMSGSTSRSGNDTLTVETGVRIPYPIPGRIAKRRFFFFVVMRLKIVNNYIKLFIIESMSISIMQRKWLLGHSLKPNLLQGRHLTSLHSTI